MRINTRFPVAVHALALIALNTNPQRPSTSELIAKSAGTNPVVVRRILSQLRRAGLVDGGPGKPGNELARPAQDISLGEIYRAVQEKEQLFDVHRNPSQQCWIGHNIHGALQRPLQQAQKALENELDSVSLQEIAEEISRRARKTEKHPSAKPPREEDASETTDS